MIYTEPGFFTGGESSRLGECEAHFPIYSATKSLTSAAFMLACDDGLVSPDTPLAGFLESQYAPLMSGDFKRLPFRRFLTMTAGRYPFRPGGSDWTEHILTLGTDHSDASFHYSNIPAYLVGAALENAFDRDLMSVLDERIFAPLGIPEPTYQKSPGGHFYGATGMELSVGELIRLGRLFMNGGEYDGRRLISEQAVRLAVTPQVETDEGDSYGFFFRTDGVSFSMRGKWGQQCIICPEKQLVFAYLSHQPDRVKELNDLMKDLLAEI